MTRHGRIVASLFVAVLVAGPLVSAANESPVSLEQVMELLDQAERTRRQAADAGMEWLETSSLIDAAQREVEAGNLVQALTLARQAQDQGTLALEQAAREAQAWQDRVPR